MKFSVLTALRATLLLCAITLTAKASETDRRSRESGGIVKVAVYDPDPKHLWNRLYAAFYVRSAADGQTMGHDELDAPLWRRGSYLMQPPSFTRAKEALDEFLDRDGHKLVADPLKRAFLQRDLWAIFDHLAPAEEWTEKWREERRLIDAQNQLLNRLSQAIRRLALSREEIERLPDNYARAVASRAYPAECDPQNSKRAFLPADLLDEKGPWLSYGDPDRDPSKAAAPTHFGSYRGRAIFHVLLKLPEGRAATEAFLRQHPLRSHHSTLVPGTQVALVKQTLLIDNEGEIRPAPIIETVQIRVHRGLGTLVNAYEFHLARKPLFEGEAGGLYPLTDGEQHFSTFRTRMMHHGEHDPFEDSFPDATLRQRRIPLPRPPTENQDLMQSCMSCHNVVQHPGFGSFLTSGPLYDRDALIEATIEWKKQHPTWSRWRELTKGEE